MIIKMKRSIIVWLAAWRVQPDRTTPFRDYALLGDDILIAGEEVASYFE